jgi:hypothetical protein
MSNLNKQISDFSVKRGKKARKVIASYKVLKKIVKVPFCFWTLFLYFIFCLVPIAMSESSSPEYNIPNPNLSFSTVNCNSLNVSTISSLHQQLKVYGICKLRSDIIFLSDTRLNSDKNPSVLKKIETQFLYNPYSSYDIYHNSKYNARGVGILI